MRETIRSILIDDCGLPESIGDDTKLRIEAGMDSVGFVLAVTLIEEAFGVEITDEELTNPSNLMTVNGMMSLVRGKTCAS